jgi:anion-transporting  ArsA/GET3 family ATPase
VSTRLWIVVGGGGVGKTTTSAALGVAFAKQGRRSLVITVDPARRLADALGVELDVEATKVRVDGATLDARMPDSRRSVEHFVDWLWLDPAARRRVRDNPMFRELGDALAGVHEMVSLAVLERDVQSGNYDDVILDTAPSRHALELFDYPHKLIKMLDERTLRFMIGLARLAGAALEQRPQESRLFAWGKRRAGALVSHLVGERAIVNIAALFVELEAARERWLTLVQSVAARLESESTRYLVIAAPSGAALDDAAHLCAELTQRRSKPTALIINRTHLARQVWPELDAGDPLYELVSGLRRDSERLGAQTQVALKRVRAFPETGASVAALPAVDAVDPTQVLIALADHLAGQDWLQAPASD